MIVGDFHFGEDFPDAGDGQCCYGAAIYGPRRCTCWEPVYDVEQQEPRPAERFTRFECCHDCAHRSGSPERLGDPDHAFSAPGDLEAMAADAKATFFCHQGARRIVAWRHPSGVEIAGAPQSYCPPVIDGVAYQASGEPMAVCAGFAALRRRLLQESAA